MRKSLKSVSEGRAETEGARLGSFTDKTALELFISPNSIHAAEAVDPHVIGRLIQWLDLSFYGRERSKSPIRVHCHVFFSVILLAGSFLTLMWAGVMLHFLKPSLAKGLWALALAVTGFCLALGPSPASCLVWFMSIFLSGMVSSHYSRSFDTVPAAHGRLADAAGKIVAYVLLFFLAFGISKLLFGMKLLFSNPDNTRAFPFSLFVSYFLYPCALLNGIVEMIRDYSPQVLWIAVSGSLILYIAAICRMERIEEIGSRFLDSFTRWRRFKPTEPPSSKQKILAAVLCAFALLSAFQLYRAGLADMDVLTPYVSFSTKNLIVPVGLWVLFVRTLKEPRRT
ncbi:MAG: hypothetical protein HYU64_11455 [Armatimonadetes bacterium]|nr:hypothetical protein [Armatimonadota bacterium]